nr:MAG TPA: tail tube protein [Caudoviricetes sp.]
MGIALTSIGIKISYATEVTKGTRPTAGYTVLPDLKSIPDFNPQPNTADATTFDNLEYTSYVKLLKDIGGALEFNANLTQDLYDAWSVMVTARNNLTEGKQMWYCVDIPKFDKSIFFTGDPSEMGIPSAEANSLLETSVYIVPTSEPVFADDPTYAA